MGNVCEAAGMRVQVETTETDTVSDSASAPTRTTAVRLLTQEPSCDRALLPRHRKGVNSHHPVN
mgnify:CR=1 FL=1